jgi:hypothetical protein
MLSSYIIDPVRTKSGFRDYRRIDEVDAHMVRITHSLPSTVNPERSEPLTWLLGFYLPFALLEKYVGPLAEVSGQSWRGNFYKCGDETSHPHWASWSPVDSLNFHLPNCFGRISFNHTIADGRNLGG